MPNIVVSDKLYTYLLSEKKNIFDESREQKALGEILDMKVFGNNSKKR